jgi:hypothetical protein
VNSRNFVLIAAVFALIGLLINVATDLDSPADMGTTLLLLLAFVFALLGAFMGRNK